MEKTVKIEQGDVVLIKPKAGQRNKALIEAEKQGNGSEPSKTVFIMELLPGCVKSHPWGATPIRQALDTLEFDDYDKLAKAMGELINPLSEQDLKK